MTAFRPPRLFGHPAHAPLTHFPLALWSAACAADILDWICGGIFWRQFGFYALAGGCAIGLLTLLTGFLDLLGIPENNPEAERKAFWHMSAMGTASLFFGADLYLHWAPGTFPWEWTLASGAGTLLIQVGGWLGGELVYRHGIGYHGKPSSSKE